MRMTKYNPQKHHRRSVRLRGYDYSQPGAYFVTLNVRDGECVLGDVVDGHMQWTALGRIVNDFWAQVPVRFPHVSIDQQIVMPNHAHAIIIIHEGAEGAITAPRQNRPTLGQIVAFYKYETTTQINDLCGNDPMPFWQRSFYEHIIRNQRALEAVRKYIADNPFNWELDQDHPNNMFSARKGKSYGI